MVLRGMIDEGKGLCALMVSMDGVGRYGPARFGHTVVMEIHAGRRSRGSEDAPER